MRVVVWNCNMALDRKLARLLALRPDVAVIPECADPSLPRMECVKAAAAWTSWAGENPNKGLAVLTFGRFRGETLRSLHTYHRHFLPVRISGPSSLTLVGVWTQSDSGLKGYRPALRGGLGTTFTSVPRSDAVVAGDFNVTDVSGVQDEFGLASAYHCHFDEPPGAESRMTLFNKKNADRGYHLDYVCVPKAWERRIKKVELGEWRAWRAESDHVPLMVDLNVP